MYPREMIKQHTMRHIVFMQFILYIGVYVRQAMFKLKNILIFFLYTYKRRMYVSEGSLYICTLSIITLDIFSREFNRENVAHNGEDQWR